MRRILLLILLSLPGLTFADPSNRLSTNGDKDWRDWSDGYRRLDPSDKAESIKENISLSGLGRLIDVGPCRSPKGVKMPTPCVQATLRWQHDELRVQFARGTGIQSAQLKPNGTYQVADCQLLEAQDWGLGVIAACQVGESGHALTAKAIDSARKSPRTSHRKRRRKAAKAVVPDWVKELRAYRKLEAAKQSAFLEALPGRALKGSGKVTAKGRCRYFDRSILHGAQCARLTLKNGSDYVNLYFASERYDEVMKARLGKKYAFAECRAINMTSWTLWFELQCDIAPVSSTAK